MSGHSQKLVKNRPTRVPSVRLQALALKPRARRSMEWRISVRSVDQDIGIDEEQSLSAFHGLVQRVPIGNINQGAAAVEDWQRPQIGGLFLRPEQVTQCGLYQF